MDDINFKSWKVPGFSNEQLERIKLAADSKVRAQKRRNKQFMAAASFVMIGIASVLMFTNGKPSIQEDLQVAKVMLKKDISENYYFLEEEYHEEPTRDRFASLSLDMR